ncbi:MAG TPA: NADH-quinone oxidoreductase subunit M [Anaerolineales bacterium]|nr:NADH-quinone oxidoreductase subunit M [Anaerolineales bacterium]
MDFIQDHLLTLILFSPTFVAFVMVFFPSNEDNLNRWAAFVGSLIPLVFSLVLWFNFDRTQTGFQFEEQAVWYSAINSSYHLGVDGISLPMVLLTTLLTPLSILASFGIKDRVKSYMILFLFLETGMLGVFVALDLLIFFVFYEVGLVPMYFLINQWGSEKGERELWGGMKVSSRLYASFKFMIYTMGASLGLLLAIQMIGAVSGTFDLIELYQSWTALEGTLFGLSIGQVKAIAFWAFAIAFAVKVPVWPFHTWLPDAHTEAPTAGSMILAGVLLKLGAYGFIRLVIPLYPGEAKYYASALAFLAMMAIIFGAFASYGQTDFKRLVAYSSVNHMGFVVLGIAAAAWVASGPNVQDGIIAMNGAVLQMFNHGLSAAGMFFLVGVIYDRTHTRNLNDFGGLFPLVPVYGGILIFTSMASLGLPGLNGFVSEFLVVRGSWPVFTLFTALSMIGLLFTGAYILKGIKQTLHGPLNEKWIGQLSEINSRELWVIAPLMVLMLWLGIWPAWLLGVINQAVTALFG